MLNRAFSQMHDPSSRLTAEMDLMGRGAVNLDKIFSKQDGIDRFVKKIEDAGRGLSDTQAAIVAANEAAEKAIAARAQGRKDQAAARDSLNDMATRFTMEDTDNPFFKLMGEHAPMASRFLIATSAAMGMTGPMDAFKDNKADIVNQERNRQRLEREAADVERHRSEAQAIQDKINKAEEEMRQARLQAANEERDRAMEFVDRIRDQNESPLAKAQEQFDKLTEQHDAGRLSDKDFTLAAGRLGKSLLDLGGHPTQFSGALEADSVAAFASISQNKFDGSTGDATADLKTAIERQTEIERNNYLISQQMLAALQELKPVQILSVRRP